MSMAQVWLARLRAGAGAARRSRRPAVPRARQRLRPALRRRPRALFEYQP